MQPQSQLRLAVAANAGFSALSAGICWFATDAVARFTGIPADMIASLGIELGAFATALAFIASRRDLGQTWIRRAVGVVVALDVMWVLGSIALLSVPTSLTLTVAGQWTVGLVALAVADFAFFQYRGLRITREETHSSAVAVPAAA